MSLLLPARFDPPGIAAAPAARFHAWSWIAVMLLLWVCLAQLPVVDYAYYADAVRAWRHGASHLYDAHSVGFYYMPWSLLLLVPLSALPDAWGQALLNCISIAGLLWAVVVLVQPARTATVALALLTPFTVSVVLLGQWDALLLVGAALAYRAVAERRPWALGAALLLLSTKPASVVLLCTVILWSIRTWSRKSLAVALGLPALVVAGSGWVAGWDWPGRYIDSLLVNPPAGFNVSLLRPGVPAAVWIVVALAVVSGMILVIRRVGFAPDTVALALVGGMLLSPYVVPYHLVAVAPTLGLIAKRSIATGAVTWVAGAVAFTSFLVARESLPMGVFMASLFVYFTWTTCRPIVPLRPGARASEP